MGKINPIFPLFGLGYPDTQMALVMTRQPGVAANLLVPCIGVWCSW